MRWFLGPPRSVVSQMNNFSGNYNIDDNMVSTISFHNNAIGVIDVSWVHRHGPNPLEIYGTEGYLGIDTSLNGPRVQIVSNLLAAGEIKGVINPSNLPTAMPSPMQQWVNAIKNGTTMEMNIHDGFYLTQLMEGCYTAARHGHEFTF